MKFKVGDKVHFIQDYYDERGLLYSNRSIFTVTSIDGYGFIKIHVDEHGYWNERLFERIEE